MSDSSCCMEKYQKALKYEQGLSAEGAACCDPDFLRTVLTQMFTHLDELNSSISSKSSKTTDKAADSTDRVQQLKSSVIMGVLSLKMGNRVLRQRLSACRQETAERLARFDSRRLALQNLLYENAHICSSINACLQFRSKDEKLKLISLEEFRKMHPNLFDQSNEAPSEHELRLRRLQWEIERRKALAADCTALASKQQEAVSNIEAHRHKLASLADNISQFIKNTEPLQRELDMPFTQKREQCVLANSLPTPLFVIYSQFKALSDTSNLDISVKITEESDDIIKQTVAHNSQNFDELFDFCSSRDILDTPQSVEAILQTHFLSISISILCQDEELNNDSNAQIVLNFYWLPYLELVSVISRLDCSAEYQGIHTRSQPLLTNLSVTSVTPAATTDHTEFTHQTLCRAERRFARLAASSMCEAFTGTLGRHGVCAYSWAHCLAGLCCPLVTTAELEVRKKHNSMLYVEKVVSAIRDRVHSRISLQHQINQLEAGQLISAPLSNQQPTGSPALSSTVFTWKLITEEAFVCHLSPFFERNSFAADNAIYYQLSFNNPEKTAIASTLDCYAAIRDNYPLDGVMFVLHLTVGDSLYTADTHPLREVEYTLNCVLSKQLRTCRDQRHLLTTSLIYLRSVFDRLRVSEWLCSVGTAPPTGHSDSCILLGPARMPALYYDPYLNRYTHTHSSCFE